jgi:hypothetical protein
MSKAETSLNRGPSERAETPPEFSRRVQDMIDQDSWQGVDRVGNDFPEPAEIVEYPADETTRIYRRKDGV